MNTMGDLVSAEHRRANLTRHRQATASTEVIDYTDAARLVNRHDGLSLSQPVAEHAKQVVAATGHTAAAVDAEELQRRLDAADKRVEQLAERVGVLIGRIEVLERAWRVAMKKLGGNAINIEDTRE